MLKRTRKLNKIEIDDIVLLHVPTFDRGPADPRNLLCVVFYIKNYLIQLGFSSGILDIWYARNAFDDTNSNN